MDPSYFFCPQVGCRAHRLNPPQSRWYQRYGFHHTRAFGRVQRYQCLLCRKTFSDQTFLINYWLKKRTDFAALGRECNSASSGNFVARHHHYSADTVRVRQDRLARNALYYQTIATEGIRITEALVADGLESYVRSQDFPVSLNVLIGKGSQFVYFFTESHSRRKGKKSEEQRARADLVYADKSFQGSRLSSMFARLLGYLEGRCAGESVELNTDEHPIYRQVIEGWNVQPGRKLRIEQRTTSSKAPRTRSNPLFAANYFDRLIRKDLPNHRRETICQARNDRNLLSRFAYYVFTHNFAKPFRVSPHAKQSDVRHADRTIGRSEELELWRSRFYEKRFFRSFVELPEYFEQIWFRSTPTPLNEKADPVPQFAYQ